MKDKSGREIEAGDYIVYGHALGRCAGLRYGLVLEYAVDAIPYKGEPVQRIKIIGVNDDWYRYKPSINMKTSILKFSERILILSEDQIPEQCRQVIKIWLNSQEVYKIWPNEEL